VSPPKQATGAGRGAPAAGDETASLRHAHLPAGLPVLPRVRIAACYRPAGQGEAAGGWFDAVPLADGAVALLAGTVVGRGIPAVAAMGELRAVLNELLAAEHDLATVALRADRFAATWPALQASTLVLAVLGPDGTLRYATCGHCPPVIAGAAGTARWLPVTGAGPLGTGSAPVLASDRLRPGDLVLLCSGGSAGRSGQTLDESLAQLAHAAADARADRSAATRTAPTAADRVSQHTAGLLSRAGQSGDVLTLAAEWLPAAVPELNLDLPGIPGNLRTARHALADWLSQCDPLVQDRDTLQLAAGEILGNAIEHAYPPGRPGPIRLQAALGADGQLECRVSDRGSWKVPDPAIPGRGAGLMLVGRMIDQLDVHHPPQPPGEPPGARGTVVSLRHRLRRPAAIMSAASPPLAARAAGPPFQVDSGADGYAAWARVCGPVELAAAGSLRSQLLIACRGGTLPLSVDLSEVTQLGGAGVRALYQVRGQLAIYQQSLSLVTAPGSVADAVLGLAGLPYAKRPQSADLASRGDTSPASGE
jgi:anti-sigma regulatory factor (Ser/Thr protein kinase)